MPRSQECEACGACLLGVEGKEVLLLARNEANASEGDTVEIEIAPGRVMAAAFIIYVIPILLTIVGFVVGNAMTGGDPESDVPIFMAVGFLVVSFIAVWLYDLRLRRVERREAVVIRVLTDVECAETSRVSRVKFGG